MLTAGFKERVKQGSPFRREASLGPSLFFPGLPE